MIKVLHYNPHIDSMITQYVTMLANAMSGHADVSIATSLAQFRKMAASVRPDIVHLHGCWRFSIAIAEYIGKKCGARIVVSPHGQLEPWILRNRYFTYRLPRLIVYQRRIIANAYAVIAMGNMEQRCISHFTDNPRLEKVLNALITQKISEDEMASQIMGIYQKVMDSCTLELMDDNTRDVLAMLIKAGITGDTRWIDSERMELLRNDESEIGWRQLLLYACHEDIMPVIAKGISVAGVATLPDIGVESISHYAPSHYKPYAAMASSSSDATEQAFSFIKTMQKEAAHKKLPIGHIIQFHQLLFEQELNEDRLQGLLTEHGLDRFASRLMHVMSELTLLEEGYMVAQPADDRASKHLQKRIENRLKI